MSKGADADVASWWPALAFVPWRREGRWKEGMDGWMDGGKEGGVGQGLEPNHTEAASKGKDRQKTPFFLSLPRPYLHGPHSCLIPSICLSI